MRWPDASSNSPAPTPGRGYQAHAYRLLGEVARRREPPDVDQATAHYRQALALAEELGMRPLQAHCHLGLGTLYATTGQRQQAHAELSAAIDLYRAMDMTFWLPQAEAAWRRRRGRGEKKLCKLYDILVALKGTRMVTLASAGLFRIANGNPIYLTEERRALSRA